MLAVAVALGSQAHAALFDAYVEIEGVTKPESKLGLKIQGVSFNSTAPAATPLPLPTTGGAGAGKIQPIDLQVSSSGGGGGAGKVQVEDLQIEFDGNDVAPQMFLHNLTQKNIPKVTITFYQMGQKLEKYIVIKLTDVLVSSFSFTHNGQEQPRTRASLNFTKIHLELFQDGKPAGEMGWDVKTTKQI